MVFNGVIEAPHGKDTSQPQHQQHQEPTTPANSTLFRGGGG